jgi:diadenosine tetraphosphate (Ap4A) HIT family hydrolase
MTVQTVARAVKTAMVADGLTIQQFNESAGGQVVFHLHFHIIPRWEDDLHFPAPVWAAAPQHDALAHTALEARKTAIASRVPAYHLALQQALG